MSRAQEPRHTVCRRSVELNGYLDISLGTLKLFEE